MPKTIIEIYILLVYRYQIMTSILSANTTHQSIFSSTSISLCSANKTSSSLTRRRRRKIHAKTTTRQYHDTSINQFPTTLHYRSPRLHSPRLNVLDDLQTAGTILKQNLHRVNYCEPNIPVIDQQLSFSLETSTDTTVTINSDQDRIDRKYLIRWRKALDFSAIVDSYYHSNKLVRGFTSKKWFTVVIAPLFDIRQQPWSEFCSVTRCKSSTDNIASPKKNSPEPSN